MPTPLYDLSFAAADLMARHPPRWTHPNKILVQSVSCPDGAVYEGTVRACRWPAVPIRDVHLLDHAQIQSIDARFMYDDIEDKHIVWYPNFADPDLFGYWSGPLLAQDELQVAEHPVLAALRSELLARGESTRTIESGAPTPFTLEGIERRCAIDISPHPSRPLGLYGNRFARAPASEVLAATRRIDPPTQTRLVAMAAPVGGRGAYTTLQIDWVLTAAHTAFSAVCTRSEGQPVRLHAGFWGCGAFGGNRVLMALLQLVAAGSAGVSEVVFHTFSSTDRDDLAQAIVLLGKLAQTGPDPADWVMAVHRLGFQWGVSDGN